MSEQDKLLPPPQGSQSGQASQSRDVLDSASVRELIGWMHGTRQRLDDAINNAAAESRKGQFREQTMVTAINRTTAEMKALRVSVDKALKLLKEVARSGQQTMEGAALQIREATGKFQTFTVADDEITGQHIKLRWATVLKWVPIVAKVGAVVATGVAAAYGFFKAFIQRFTE